MRLLHTNTLTLKDFPDARYAPPYAILSHVWRDEEVLFHDIQDLDTARDKKGYAKVWHCCSKARREGYIWVWIDTCCIDKSSSAELSEAINSMYTWYNKSEVCYAYLDDVPKGVDPTTPISAFGGSKWFTRGWTLQELIAPKQVVFLAQDWSDIGTRKKLVDILRNITGIDRNVLLGLPAQLSVAQRMSWAAHRVTTREEDVAYSLMGLFGINMPTIYGEGKQAFIRLQYEIMQRSTDHSVFTWESDGVEGFLAPNPACFQPSHRDIAYCDIRGIPYEEFARAFAIEDPLPEHAVTNHGIRIRLPVRTYETEKGDIEYVAALACQKWDRWGDPCPRQNMLCALRLRLVEGTINQYSRVGLSDVDIREAEQFASKDVYLEHDRNPATFDIHQDETPVTFLISSGELTQRELVVSELMPRRMWEVDSSGGLCLTIDGYYNSRRCGVALFREERTGQRWAIVLGAQHVQSYSRDWTSLSSSFLVMDLLVDNSDGLWANLPSEPDFDNDAARMIWEHYQGLDGSEGNSTHGIFLQPSTGRHLAQFFQRSILLGSGFAHLTINTSVRPPERGWVNVVNLYIENSPYLMGWDLVWLLGSILGHVRGPNMQQMADGLDRNEFKWTAHERALLEEFQDKDDVVMISQIPAALKWKCSPPEEVWGTYVQKVLFHEMKSKLDDDEDSTHNYGTLSLRCKDILSVGAYWGEAYRLAQELERAARSEGQGDELGIGDIVAPAVARLQLC